MVATASALYRLCGWYGVAFVHVRSPLPCELTASPQVAKVCVPLFLFSRRNKGDPDMKQLGSAVKQQDEDVDEGTQPRYVPCIDAGNAAFDAELLHSDHTRLNPRPSSPGYQHFRPSGQSLGYRSQ